MSTETTLTPSDGPTALGKMRWVVALALLVLLTEQTALGFTLIAPALGGFAAEFQTTQIIWMITIFTLVGGVVTPVIGKLGDRFGKKRVLVWASMIGVAGSVICALAPTFGMMLVGRALMGLSTAFLPITVALIRDVFPASYRNLAIGISTNGVGVVTIAGPFLAGFLIDNVSLDAVFWFVGAISLVGGLGAQLVVPESPYRVDTRIDVGGVIGLMAGLLLVMYGISQLATWEFTDLRTGLTIGGGLAVLGAWWVWEGRAAEPFIDTRLLASRPMLTTIGSYALAGGAITVMASYLPTMLQTPRALGVDYGFGLSATGVARYLIVAGVLTVAGGVVVGLLATRFGFRTFLIAGSAAIALGALGLGSLMRDPWMPIVFYGVVGLGAMIFAAAPGLLMVLSPVTSRGVTAGMMGAISAAVGSGFVQSAGLVLNKNVAQVVQGYPVYSSRGWTIIFLMAASMAVAGAVVAMLIPRREDRVPSEVDADTIVITAMA